MLTFEGTPIQGVSAIIEKLTVSIVFWPLNLTAGLTPILFSSLLRSRYPFRKYSTK